MTPKMQRTLRTCLQTPNHSKKWYHYGASWVGQPARPAISREDSTGVERWPTTVWGGHWCHCYTPNYSTTSNLSRHYSPATPSRSKASTSFFRHPLGSGRLNQWPRLCFLLGSYALGDSIRPTRSQSSHPYDREAPVLRPSPRILRHYDVE